MFAAVYVEMTVAEAMYCECIPIVTKRGALPEIIDDTGFLTDYDDVKSTVYSIKKGLKSNNGKKARNRIIGNFSLREREKKLVKMINEIMEIR